MDYSEIIEKIVLGSLSSIGSLREQTETIIAIARTITYSVKNGGTIFLVGNGGSAADAQHSAAEFIGKLGLGDEREPIRAISLTTDTSILTAISNDFGFEEVFARQLRALGKKGDILIAISTSGKSKNIFKAISAAEELGIEIILLTGKKCNPSNSLNNIIRVEGDNTPEIQAGHGTALHIICALVERMLSE